MGDKSTVVEKAPDDKDKMLEMTIEELDLSVRSFNLSLIHICMV